MCLSPPTHPHPLPTSRTTGEHVTTDEPTLIPLTLKVHSLQQGSLLVRLDMYPYGTVFEGQSGFECTDVHSNGIEKAQAWSLGAANTVKPREAKHNRVPAPRNPRV